MLQFGSLRRSSSRLLHRGIREKKEFSNIVIDKNPKNPFLPRSEFQKKKNSKKKMMLQFGSSLRSRLLRRCIREKKNINPISLSIRTLSTEKNPGFLDKENSIAPVSYSTLTLVEFDNVFNSHPLTQIVGKSYHVCFLFKRRLEVYMRGVYSTIRSQRYSES